jgi:triacylglycerol lipase
MLSLRSVLNELSRFVDVSLVDPGNATNFFDLFSGLAFKPELAELDVTNALWLAELSRLIYRRSGEVASHEGKSRADFLGITGLKEEAFFTVDGTEAAIIDGGTFRVLVFRGTEPPRLAEDFLTDVKLKLVPWPHGGRVAEGFSTAFLRVFQEILKVRDRLTAPLFITGHSLGGALAELAASQLRADGIPVRATYTFGCPRVGDAEFARSIASLPLYRVVNDRDIVARVPTIEHFGYHHVGTLIHIDGKGALHVTADPRDADDIGISILKLGEDLLDHAPMNYVELLRRAVTRPAVTPSP